VTLPNVIWPARGRSAYFVGGVPSPMYPGIVNVESLHEGEIVGQPFFSDGVTWVRVHVPGVGDDLLVPVENLR
jgi:hypothetical protein